MKVEVKNFGPIKNAKMKLSRFTLLFGPNNCGKTYMSYAIWGIINHISKTLEYPLNNNEIKLFLKNGYIEYEINKKILSTIISNCVEKFEPNINRIFNCNEKFFSNSTIKVSDIKVSQKLVEKKNVAQVHFGKDNDFTITIVKEGSKNAALLSSEKPINVKFANEVLSNILGKIIADAHIKPLFRRAFSITSERTGASLFYKNLDYNKSEAIDYILKNKNINPFTVIEKITSRYALPIQKNIDFVRDYEDRSKKESFILLEKEKYKDVLIAWNNVLGGSFINKEDAIEYLNDKSKKSVPLHLSSSATKSLFLIDAYLRHEIRKGDVLFIDEPELNLSPKNQVAIAQFLIELTKIGIGVFVTTHSDYIVREINIFLQKDKYQSFSKDDISLYTFDENLSFKEIEMDDDGFCVSHFDDIISSQIERASS